MPSLSGNNGLGPSRPLSRRDALRYGATASALAGLGLAAAGTLAPEAAAAAPTLIDFAMRQIPAQDIRAAGHAGVINYVSTSRPGSSFGAKPITKPYAQSLTAAGLAIVSNYQYGKPGGTAPSDFTRGYAGGVSDARTAWQLHTAAGGAKNAQKPTTTHAAIRNAHDGRWRRDAPTTRAPVTAPSAASVSANSHGSEPPLTRLKVPATNSPAATTALPTRAITVARWSGRTSDP